MTERRPLTDEQLAPELGSWLKDRNPTPPDAKQSARHVAARLPQARQLGRWRWLPSFERTTASAPTTDQTTDYQSTPIQATNHQPPTVKGRTQFMFSPAKAITAGVLIFAIGGVLFVAEPFDQQADPAPGAESVEFAEAVEFTAVFESSFGIESATCESVGGVSQCRGQAWSWLIEEEGTGSNWVSDPRLAGRMTTIENVDQYRGSALPPPPFFVTSTYRIVNDDGAWEGSYTTTRERGEYAPTSFVLVGEGDYAGLHAWMTTADWPAISGVIFPAAPPEAPAPPPAS